MGLILVRPVLVLRWMKIFAHLLKTNNILRIISRNVTDCNFELKPLVTYSASGFVKFSTYGK